MRGRTRNPTPQTVVIGPLCYVLLAGQIVHVHSQQRVCQLPDIDERDVGVDPADGAVLNVGCFANLPPQRKIVKTGQKNNDLLYA